MSSCPETVVKAYGRDCFLLVWNPLAAGLMNALGLRVGVFSDAQVLDRMQKDVIEMRGRGYRVTSTDECRVPLLFLPGRSTSYYQVAYERLERPVAGQRGVG